MLAVRRSLVRSATSALRVNHALTGVRAVHLEANKASVQVTKDAVWLDALIKKEPVVVFSKTYCPHCAKVKALFKDLETDFELVELDVRPDGAEIQSLLLDLTKQRTVPNVFIKGQHIGGADATLALHADKKLVPLLK